MKPLQEINTVLVARVVAAVASGSNDAAVCSELGITHHMLKRIQRMDEYKKSMESMSSEILNSARSFIRVEIGKMSKEIIRVLRSNLDDDNLEAVKIALKVAGFGEDDKPTAETNIQVVLPGAAEPTTIEVPNYADASEASSLRKTRPN